jgi:hypothetical protein
LAGGERPASFTEGSANDSQKVRGCAALSVQEVPDVSPAHGSIASESFDAAPLEIKRSTEAAKVEGWLRWFGSFWGRYGL